jgi:hypothetical protein
MNNLVTFCFVFTHECMDSIELYTDAARTNLSSAGECDHQTVRVRV